jgi:hypothetical protein
LGKVEEIFGNLKGKGVSGTNLKILFFQFQIKSGTAQAHNKCFDLVRETRDPWSEASDPVREALDLRAYPLKRDSRLDPNLVARDSRICPDLAHTLTRPCVSPYKRDPYCGDPIHKRDLRARGLTRVTNQFGPNHPF